MNKIQKARGAYESVPIPDDLEKRVREGIRRGREAGALRRRRQVQRRAAIAACFALLLAGLPLEDPAEYTQLVCSLMI